MHYDYRNDFPLLMQNKIIYIDNAATSQRPQCVIDAEGDFYKNYNANQNYIGVGQIALKLRMNIVLRQYFIIKASILHNPYAPLSLLRCR